MTIPDLLKGRLSVPVIAAPLFLISNPDLVVETCRAGVVGTFPTLNQRTTEGYEAWLNDIETRLTRADAPFGVNLIVGKGNDRLEGDLAVTVAHEVPIVITSLGIDEAVIRAVQAYGGLVFHDITTIRHARKAAAAGVDGIIAVAAGAGGHAGAKSPFALAAEIREFFDGALILAGAINTGRQVAAARLMGADLAYIGTRFIATQEAQADPEYKQMLLESSADDIVYTPAISGMNANFLRNSIIRAGLDPDAPSAEAGRGGNAGDIAKAWKHVWSAGQGVGTISDICTASELCARLVSEYRSAARVLAA